MTTLCLILPINFGHFVPEVHQTFQEKAGATDVKFTSELMLDIN